MATTSLCSAAMADVAIPSRPQPLRRLNISATSVIAVAGPVLALALGYALAAKGSYMAAALLAIPLAGWMLHHRGAGFVAAAFVALTVPYAWHHVYLLP